jgi:hypothetical protein
VKIDYGPPAMMGVKHLQYVGDDADYTSTGLQSLAKPVGLGALGVWGFAAVTGNQGLKKLALGVSVGAFLVQALGGKK